MSKIIYFTILVTLPLLAATVAYAQPRKQARAQVRQQVICGHVMKAETFFVKSTPVVYVVTNQGRSYTLFPEIGNGTERNAAARMQLIQSLYYLQPVCLNGLAYTDIFMPNSIVVRNGKKNGRDVQPDQPQQRQQQTASARRSTGWVPWNRSQDANP